MCSKWTEYVFCSQSFSCLCVPFKQNEENKKKNKQAALKAQMDLEEARKGALQAAEQQKNDNASLQDHEGETVELEIKMKEDVCHGLKLWSPETDKMQ